MRALGLLVVALAACDPPPVKIKYDLSDTDVQPCPASCVEIPMTCDAVLSVRIFQPGEPTAAPIDICEVVEPDHDHDVCSIANVDLVGDRVPETTLEVQVAVYPRSALPSNANGDPICPTSSLRWSDTTGFPVEAVTPGVPMPALGGRTYYHVGDSLTTVRLGCTDLSQLVCAPPPMTKVVAPIGDLSTLLAVKVEDGEHLTVAVGEPHARGSGYEQQPDDETQVFTTDHQVWSGDVKPFAAYACTDVVEGGIAMTPTLSCRVPSAEVPLGVPGWRLDRVLLQTILGAIGVPEVPAAGMTIGVVVDSLGNRVSGAHVQTDPAGSGTILYVRGATSSSTGTTDASGLFVSTDAPFPVTFSASVGNQPGGEAIGGMVSGKVTIVVLKLEHVIGG